MEVLRKGLKGACCRQVPFRLHGMLQVLVKWIWMNMVASADHAPKQVVQLRYLALQHECLQW